MGTMSWSDDTRCLYCEGRLPLYRKITHGQFCSSAHRKSYWQEQERLAVERLHQTHNSLRAYSSTQTEAPEESSLHGELQQAPVLGAISLPAADPVPVLAEAPLTVPDLIGSLVPELLPRGGSWPDLVAADPFEYEFTCQPLALSAAFGKPETRPLPEGQPIPAWACLGMQPWTGQETQKDSRPEECELALCHPRSQTHAPQMQAAARVG